MTVEALHHFTLRCDADDLPGLAAFYEGVLGLRRGARPGLRFDGLWLYAGEQPVVHLYASGRSPTPEGSALDHIAFRATGLDSTRETLRTLGVAFTEAPVPGWPLHQVFVRDPLGLKLELTFDLVSEGGAA